MLAVFVYVVVMGGTGRGELDLPLRMLNATIAGVLIVGYLLRAPARADRIDGAVLAALVLFAVAGALSAFPRQSLDAVLAATTYVTGFFFAREYLANDTVRTAFVRVLMGLSTFFTAAVALLWLPKVIEWWSLTSWTVLPPLDFNLSSGSWGHRYDMALLIALLYPAWWIGRPSALRRSAAIAVGLVGLALIIVTGSRTTWLALAVATAVLGIPVLARFWRQRPGGRLPITAAALLLGAGGIVSGLAAPLVERAANIASLDWRTAMWGPLVDLWLAHPIAGVGPGSFPWALQLTPYFETRSWAPRHPDSALFQLLPEAGVLGLVALTIVLIAVVPAVVRGRSSAARWVAVAFAVACIGANPTDFAFLVVLMLAWAAYAAPHPLTQEGPSAARRGRAVLMASALAVGIISVSYAATLAGSAAYEAARTSIRDGRLADARGALDIAVAADPGMALYLRQRGAVHYLAEREEHAIRDLERAVTLNPSDDLAWRTLSLAYERQGDTASARAALGHALESQRSDPTNLLLSARLATSERRTADAVDLLAEVVQSWPAIVAAPGWSALLPDSVTTADVIDAAATRWRNGAPMPEMPSDQGIWLGVLSARADVLESAIEQAPFARRLAEAHAMLIGCDLSAGRLLEDATTAERRHVLYWHLRVRESVLRGTTDVTAARALQIMTGGGESPDGTLGTLNPLDENAALSADRFGYRRYPVRWPSDEVVLPSLHAGASRWFNDPAGATEAAGLDDRLKGCSKP